MNIHIKASLKDLAFRDRCEPVIANTVCINAFRKWFPGGGDGQEKLYFLTYLKEGGFEVLQFSSVIIVADMFQILIIGCTTVTVMNVIFNKK